MKKVFVFVLSSVCPSLLSGCTANVNIPPEEITYFIIGLPSDNNLDDNHEKMYIIPYAIYRL